MKPILLITLRTEFLDDADKQHFSDKLKLISDDYHILMLEGIGQEEEIKMQVLSAEELDEEKADELINRIKEQWDNLNKST